VDGAYTVNFCDDEIKAMIDAWTRSLVEALSPEDLAKMKEFLKNYKYTGGPEDFEDLLTKAEAFNAKSRKYLLAAEELVKLVREQTRHQLKCQQDMISAISKSMESSANDSMDHLTSLLSAKLDVSSTSAQIENKIELHAVLAREKSAQSQVVQLALQNNQLKSEKLEKEEKEENDKLEVLKKEEEAKLELKKLEKLEKLRKKAALKAAAQKEQAERDFQATIAAIEKTFQDPEAIEEDSSSDELE